MPVTRPFLLYLRSRLNLGVSIGAACLVLLSVAFLRPYALIPALAIVAAYAALTGVLFFSRAGAREIVAESEEDLAGKVRAKIDAVSATRERIAVLRIGDERMAKAIELFLLESGAYLQKCRELSSYSPVANDRVQRVLDICQVYLDERDESSTARRYDEPGKAADPAESLARDIRECASVIRTRVTEDLLGTSGRDQLSIMKELEEKK
jgi:hypothetical protein